MTSETTVDRPLSYVHLLRLSDAFGVVEHARGLDPLTHHGYCLDDVARALVVLARDADPPPEVGPLFTMQRNLPSSGSSSKRTDELGRRMKRSKRARSGYSDWLPRV